MPDSKDKTQPRSTKTLSNSLRLKSPTDIKRRQNVSNILNRLPILRTLNETQTQLQQLKPVWQQWCNQNWGAEQANSITSNDASLLSLDGDTLSISCKHSSTATLFKHHQHSLVEALQSHGFKHIQNIRIRMSLKSSENELNHHTKAAPNSNPANSSVELTHNKSLAASVKSIEATQPFIKNQQLAASLKRLAETLKKNT